MRQLSDEAENCSAQQHRNRVEQIDQQFTRRTKTNHRYDR